jgi:very-long-chain ceramide synthase
MSVLSSRPSMSRIASTTVSINTMPLQPHSKEASDRRRARAESNTPKSLDPLAESTHRHTWIIPGAVSAALLLLFLLGGADSEGNPFRAFVLLSYPVRQPDGSVMWGKGWKDLLFCTFYTFVFTFVRELSMEAVLRPFSKIMGMKTKSKQARFMEQCYAIVYFITFGLFGLVGPPQPIFLFCFSVLAANWGSM